MIGRRLFLGGLLVSLSAPAIVKAHNLMKVVKPFDDDKIYRQIEIGRVYSMRMIIDPYQTPPEWTPGRQYPLGQRILRVNSVQSINNGVYVVERESIVTPKQRETKAKKWQLQKRL